MKIFFLLFSLCVYHINLGAEMYTYTEMEEGEKLKETIFLYDNNTNECAVLTLPQHDDLNDEEALAELYTKNIRGANQDERGLLDFLMQKVEFFSKPLEERYPSLRNHLDEESKKILADRDIFFDEEKNQTFTLIYYKNGLESRFILRRADDKEINILIKIKAYSREFIKKAFNKQSLN